MNRIHRRGEPDPQNILVILPTWVGDFVMATPMLRAVRERFADAHITFLHESNLRELILGGGWMDDCIEWPAKNQRTPFHRSFRACVRSLRRHRFDWAILLPNSFRSAMVARLSGAKRRIGYNRDGREFLLTDRLVPPNRVDGEFKPMPIVKYFAVLAEAIDCPQLGDRLDLATTPDCDASVDERLVSLDIAEKSPLVIISPGAKFGASKCWLPERFAAVADMLVANRDAVVIVTCGPGEEAIARTIGSQMRRDGFVFDNPRLSLGELKSLVKRADLLLCNDAGPRHIAKAFDVPVVTVFGPTHTEWTATNYEHERIVRIDVECGPCQKPVCPLGHMDCMTGVSVDMVFSACTDLLNERSPVVVHESAGK